MKLLFATLAALRFVMFAGWLALCVPIQIVVKFFNWRIQNILPIYFHKVLTQAILGMRIETRGTMSTSVPTLFLSNHLSYLDTITLASIIPTDFVAKAEVADWPIFGYLTKLQGTVFIDRNNKRGATEQAEAIINVMREEKNIMLFPEGTSTDGSDVKPFKSGLLQSFMNVKDLDLVIQPVSIACFGSNGIQNRYAWYGDMTLMPHLWTVFETSGLHVVVTFHEAFKASRFTDRKQLAEFAHSQVKNGPYGILSE